MTLPKSNHTTPHLGGKLVWAKINLITILSDYMFQRKGTSAFH